MARMYPPMPKLLVYNGRPPIDEDGKRSAELNSKATTLDKRKGKGKQPACNKGHGNWADTLRRTFRRKRQALDTHKPALAAKMATVVIVGEASP